MMFRILHIAILTAIIVACPLRCMAGSCQNGGAKSACTCCCCEQPTSDQENSPLEHEDDRGPSKCRCACLCKGATIAERQLTDVDGLSLENAIDAIGVELHVAGSTRNSCGVAESTHRDLRESGRSLRFLLASLQI